MAEQTVATEQARLSQVRDILFGEDLERIGARIHRLESKFEARVRELSEAFDQRVSSVESESQRRVDGVARDLDLERTARVAATEALEQRVEETDHAQSKRIDELGESTGNALNTLREDLAAGISDLRADLQQTRERLTHDFDRKLRALEARLVSRADLGQLLMGLSQSVLPAVSEPDHPSSL